MKRVSIVLLCILLCVLLAGCKCEHEWAEATCTEPKTCTKCKETEGEPLGHNWKAATCEEPETCTRCGEQQGELADHKWKEATCEEPETCTVCGKTQGTAKGHTWKAATCTVPKPARCAERQRAKHWDIRRVKLKWESRIMFLPQFGLTQSVQCAVKLKIESLKDSNIFMKMENLFLR